MLFLERLYQISQGVFVAVSSNGLKDLDLFYLVTLPDVQLTTTRNYCDAAHLNQLTSHMFSGQQSPLPVT